LAKLLGIHKINSQSQVTNYQLPISRYMVYPIARKTILPIFKSFVSEVEGIENLPRSGGFILAPNHIGFIDYFFLASVVIPHLNKKVHFISQKEKWWSTFGKGIDQWLGRIEVNPNDKKGCLDAAAKVLKNNGIVGIYPEGRASKSSELNKGKTGAVRLALFSGKPIVPVGLFAPMGYPNFVQSVSSLKKSYKKVKIYFGQPILFQENGEISKEKLEKITRQLMQEIAKLCNKNYPF